MSGPLAPSRTFAYDRLQVMVHEDADRLAAFAAHAAAQVLTEAVRSRGRSAVLLATGNSQLKFLERLTEEDVDWSKVSVLHLDEYVGLPEEHPASFRGYLLQHVVKKVNVAAFYGLRGDAQDLTAEVARYRSLLGQQRPDLCVLGIGENGHLAFNDPPADFETSQVVHQVSLDLRCRQQQVDEGHFADIAEVPFHALSLTVPALLSPPMVIGVTPEKRKARAVRDALEGPITPDCPASALRTAGNAVLHLDPSSAHELRAMARP